MYRVSAKPIRNGIRVRPPAYPSFLLPLPPPSLPFALDASKARQKRVKSASKCLPNRSPDAELRSKHAPADQEHGYPGRQRNPMGCRFAGLRSEPVGSSVPAQVVGEIKLSALNEGGREGVSSQIRIRSPTPLIRTWRSLLHFSALSAVPLTDADHFSDDDEATTGRSSNLTDIRFHQRWV
ncbi:hypothetical protein DFH06DRAFT_124753 [Mycena polygramma]|nr:hypothetical protein DFH06DRAFT_124753 [Mycena polygramma]